MILRLLPRDRKVALQMQRQKTKNTAPEHNLIKELQRRRFRVVTHDRGLPGTPDLVLPRKRIVIFVNGCFWHGCPEHFRPPKTNREWWLEKIESNRRRDRSKSAKLRRMGWAVITIWEHTDSSMAADRVQRFARSRSQFKGN